MEVLTMTALESVCSHRDFAVKFARTYTIPYLSSNQINTILTAFINFEITFFDLGSVLREKGLPCLMDETDLRCTLPWSSKKPHELAEKDHAYYMSDLATIELFIVEEKAQTIDSHNVIRKVLTKFVDEHMEEWNTSELGYAILGAACAVRGMPEKEWYQNHLTRLGAKLIARQDPQTGNFASEHDAEAPAGPHLVDTIYTANWVLPALQCLKEQGSDAKAKLLALLLKIQDTDPAPQFNGCWRGMYDLNTQSWGGGDRYEGGAGSIYTGWTNAPISLWLLAEMEGKDLTDLIFG